MNKLKFGLCRGRHEITEVTDYVFDEIQDVTNIKELDSIVKQKLDTVSKDTEIHLYVTGLTVALVAVINYCIKYNKKLVLWHYNNALNDYYMQEIASK